MYWTEQLAHDDIKMMTWWGIIVFFVLVTTLGCGATKSFSGHPVRLKSTKLPTLRELHVATQNLKFYGSSGGFNVPGMDHRDPYLGPFLMQELGDADLVMFTEVVNVPRLQNLVGSRWHCEGYDRSQDPGQKWHQHVTLCFDANKFRIEKYDEDWEIPEVAVGSRFLRPALQAKLCERQGPCFLQVIGVHLKAGDETPRRIEQVQALSDALFSQEQPLPTLILGDFNSYRNDRSGKAKHDLTYFEEILSESGRPFRSLTWGLPTFGSGDRARDYDHVVASSDIDLIEARAYPACAPNFDPKANALPYAKLQRLYVDHCYIKARILLP